MLAAHTPQLSVFQNTTRTATRLGLPHTFVQVLVIVVNFINVLIMVSFRGIRSFLNCFQSSSRHRSTTTATTSQKEESKKGMSDGFDESLLQICLPIIVGMYVVGKKIGSGSFGSVHFCKHRKTGTTYAGKLFNVGFIQDEENVDMIYSEVAVLKKLSHKNTISFVDLVFSRRGILLVMELVSGTDLYDMVPKNEGIVESFARVLFLQLMQAIKHLHTQRIVHRDIKVENVMIDERGTIKLVDYGLADIVPKERATKDGLIVSGVCGTKQYFSPELIHCQETNSKKEEFAGDKIDIWAVGVLLYEIVTGQRLFECSSREDLCDTITSFTLEQGHRDFSPELVDLLRSIFKTEPSERPSIEKILSHPWSQSRTLDEKQNTMFMSTSGKVQVDLLERAPEKVASCPRDFLRSPTLVHSLRKAASYREQNEWGSEATNIPSDSGKDSNTFPTLGRDDWYPSWSSDSSITPNAEKARRWEGRQILLFAHSLVTTIMKSFHFERTGKFIPRKLRREDIEQVW